MTIEELKNLRESEDKVEFKEAKTQYNYNNGRKCLLAYIVALANEKGGMLVLGMKDEHPHEVVGSTYSEGQEGQLEQNIYNDINIRIQSEVLYENTKRVLIIHVPSRPIGHPLHYNDIPLMRVGDGTERMSDEMYRSIINEQEPDFSATICPSASISDLSDDAILILKEKYSKKQNNNSVLSQSNSSFLSDLNLISNGNIKYAALILLGKKESIKRFLPQSNIIVEYRNNEEDIEHDDRKEFCEAYFLSIDEIWKLINSRNSKYHISEEAYIFDVPYFHEEVIRESIHNALAHRDYHLTSEIVIKQFPKKLIVSSPGGFPIGVTKENLINVNSTPRNRLLAEIMLRTGLVERSGQGIDKMYLRCLEEGKPTPDYTSTDNYQVIVGLNGSINDLPFVTSLRKLIDQKTGDKKLGLFDLITIYNIKNRIPKDKLNEQSLTKLINQGLVNVTGKTKGQYYELSEEHFKTDNKNIELEILDLLKNKIELKIDDFVKGFDGKYSREQIKYILRKLSKTKKIQPIGKGKGTKYKLA